jgi:hypothetical protein
LRHGRILSRTTEQTVEQQKTHNQSIQEPSDGKVKVKFPLGLTKYHAMKAYEEVEV